MFVRAKTVRSGKRTYRYLHIVENRWENGRTRQRILSASAAWRTCRPRATSSG